MKHTEAILDSLTTWRSHYRPPPTPTLIAPIARISRLLPASSVITSSVITSTIIAPTAIAQIIPDATLNQNSRVEAGCTTCFIEGGTTVGTTLFHSFEEFSIPTGSRAFFVNAADISDIISRVTGTSISNIDGRLDVAGEANLFLLNPNGVIFGPNATLSIGGSFMATTADRFEFANGQRFSAINPEPAPVSLTISTPIGLQFGTNPGAIAVQESRLRGAENRTLALVGGSLTISDADILVIPGQIELGSVGANSAIAIQNNPNDSQLELNYDNTNTFLDIDLEQESAINVSGDQGGRIQIQGRQITIREDTQVQVNATETTAGEIYVQAAESLTIIGRSFDTATGIFNVVSEEARSDKNSVIRLDSPLITLRNGAEVSTNTEGSGRAARLEVFANEILLDGGVSVGDEESTPSGFFARTGEANARFIRDINLPTAENGETNSPATGNGGKIIIESDRLTLQNGAQISTSTFREGNAGRINIQSNERVMVSGQLPTVEADLLVSGIFAQVEPGATGNGSNIRIDTPHLTVTGGAQIATAARSTGRGGNIRIDNAQRILLSGTADINRGDNISGILVSAEEGASNDAGMLTLNADRLIVEDGARISADNRGSGQGGSANITVQTLIVQNGGEILAASFADDPSQPGFDDLTPTSGGDAGSLTITAQSVRLLNDGEISVSAEDNANAGQITLKTDTLTIAGDSQLRAETFSSRGSDASLGNNSLENDTATNSDASDANDASIELTIAESLQITGGRISALTDDGQGGDVLINADVAQSALPSLQMMGNNLISAEATGIGDGGTITIRATDIILQDSSSILASTQSGTSGRIALTDVESLRILDNSTVSAATDTGTAGSITIKTIGSEVIVSGENAAISVRAEGNNGAAGDLRINTTDLTVVDGGEISVSSPNGTAGNLILTAANIVLNNGTLSAETQQTPTGATGANIDIEGINLLFANNDSLISARALDQADGGNVTLDAAQGFITTSIDVNSDIIASAFEGDGGVIQITTQGLYGWTERPASDPTNDIDVSSEFGLAGTFALELIEPSRSRELVALPGNVVDVSRLIAQQCNAVGYTARQRSDFVITGRGGLVPAPGELLSQAFWDDMRSVPSPGNPASFSQNQPTTLDSTPSSRAPSALSPLLSHPNQTPSLSAPLNSSSSSSSSLRPVPIEAQAWTRAVDGQVILLAQTSNPYPVPNPQWQTSPSCTVSR
ncbi:MAG: filamentous hemagglutinin N-terminal domain-containing protein [Cyanobacteria bacterium P01_F01_bin.150]